MPSSWPRTCVLKSVPLCHFFNVFYCLHQVLQPNISLVNWWMNWLRGTLPWKLVITCYAFWCCYGCEELCSIFVVILYGMVGRYQHFGEVYCLNVEILSSFETLVCICHNTQDHTLCVYLYMNNKQCILSWELDDCLYIYGMFWLDLKVLLAKVLVAEVLEL